MTYYVYILTNKANTVLYTGVTSDLERRLWQHRQKVDPHSFTARYHVHKLVYFETTSDVYAAISREKQIKGWTRSKKNFLISQANPHWDDLFSPIQAN